MKISDFKKFIESLEQEEMQAEMLVLYNKFKQVKDHYAMELGTDGDRTKIFVKAKNEIAKKYATKSYRKPRKPRVRAINALLKEMDKKSIFEHEMIDMYLYNVECGNVFMKDYDFFSTPLYNTMLNSYGTALAIIHKTLMEDEYKTRCLNIVNNCTNYDLRRQLRNNFESKF